MISNKQGFTVIEILVTIVIVAILATIAVLSYMRYQDQTRDAQREASVTVIAEGLEKYHDKHGEYPSCAAMVASANTVSSMLEVEASVLKAPRGTTENSMTCTALVGIEDTDNYAYIGDGSAECASGEACDYWTIQYRSDETALIKEINSRR